MKFYIMKILPLQTALTDQRNFWRFRPAKSIYEDRLR